MVFPTKEKPLTYAKKIIDSLINDEVFRTTSEEKLEEKKPLRLDTSVILDALVVKGRAGIGVSETTTGIMSDWLETLGLNDVDSVDDGDILLVIFDMIVWDARMYENKNCIRFSV